MLDTEDVINLYGPEVINYFYETVFHRDVGGGVMDEAYRWKDDIQISLHGHMLEHDSLYVEDALSEINSLDIPISITLVSDPGKSNMKIFFGNAEPVADSLLVDSVTAVGIVIVEHRSGAIERSKIGVVNDAILYSQINAISASRLRKGTVLEEIFQGLGIVGDSYTYYGNLLFEGPNEGGLHFKGISEIEKNIMKLLYDQRVFRNHRISRQEFEERFFDVLYNRISDGKLSNLACEYGLDRADLDSLGDIVFRPETADTFVKFPRKTFLKLYGDSSTADIEFCKALVKRFNTITPSFQMELAENNKLWNRFPSLNIHYEQGEEYKNILSSQVGVNPRQMMFIYNITADIWLKFYDPEKKIISYRNEKITQNLFKALGLLTRGDILVDGDLDSLEINKKYERYFRFLYDPRFPSGITKSEYLKLIKTLN